MTAQIHLGDNMSNKSSDFIQDVKDFHDKFNIPIPHSPKMLQSDVFEYRRKFLQEELDEYAYAYKNGDYLEMVDALLDLIYVAIGTLLLMGLKPVVIRETWAEVQRANITKERVKTAEHSKRGHTLDVVKPEGWTPPRHSAVFRYFGLTIPKKPGT